MPRGIWLLAANFAVTVVFAVAATPRTGFTSEPNQKFPPEDLAFFETRIRPVLVEHCYSCHSADAESIKAGLRVDSRSGLLLGGDSGPAMAPPDVDDSLLLAALRYEDYQMPPRGKLDDSVIADFEEWIRRSAPWPDEGEPIASADASQPFDLEERRATHWAWQPIQTQTPPAIDGDSTTATDVDRFILAKLQEAGLNLGPPVDRRTLIRRLSFDLTGLPPSPSDVEAFVQDTSDQAAEHLVDRLLASPSFGERWGRHWLDLVRYAESRGHEFDADTPGAYHYRDYVIRALNEDVPYDQLVREHIAGDLLPQPRLNAQHGFNESILGTGFWFLGEWVHSPVDIRKDEADRFDNMIDCVSKAFTGLTVACARCHDHKFDAISTADYYALSGFLQSSHFRQLRFESNEANAVVHEQLRKLDDRYRRLLDQAWQQVQQVTSSQFPWKREVALPKELSSPDSYRLVFDFTTSDLVDSSSPRLFPDGFAYADRPNESGQWIVSQQAKTHRVVPASYGAVRNDPFWNVLERTEDYSINPRGNPHLVANGRGVRTATFELEHGIVSVQVRGVGHVFACVDSHRFVMGPLHGETILNAREGEAETVRFLSLRLNRYLGHKIHLELVPADGETLELLRVVDGKTPITESAESKPTELTEAANWLNETLNSAGDAGSEFQKLADAWLAERTKLQAQVTKRSRLAMVMMDGTAEEDHILIRGNSNNAGELVSRRFLTALDASPVECRDTSGRLELASKITSPNNPLFSRVIVNRVWHHLMGRGIVPTVDDFGVLGERPTHPELLDHLAAWFINDGQSLKRLIRNLVLTSTYQRSKQSNAEGYEKDPNNWLYHDRPPKRLEAEIVRDALLACSSELDRTPYGPPVDVHLTPFMDGRGRPGKSGPRDGNRRRSIYLAVRRNFLSPMMLAFDAPVPFSTMGRRTVSNVPAQALILMNDPFVTERSRQWAQRLLQSHPNDPSSRLTQLYLTAFAREPSTAEAKLAMDYIAQRLGETDANNQEFEAWSDLVHALINTKEFIYIP